MRLSGVTTLSKQFIVVPSISALPGNTSPVSLPDFEELSECTGTAQQRRINCRDYVASRTNMYNEWTGEIEEAVKVALSGVT